VNKEELVTQLNAHWQATEGDYNAFEKQMRASIAKAFKVPAHLLERQVSYHRILAGEFTVTTERGRPVIELSDDKIGLVGTSTRGTEFERVTVEEAFPLLVADAAAAGRRDVHGDGRVLDACATDRANVHLYEMGAE
jgi:hypothetical protein